jgi:hypothetical protein
LLRRQASSRTDTPAATPPLVHDDKNKLTLDLNKGGSAKQEKTRHDTLKAARQASDSPGNQETNAAWRDPGVTAGAGYREWTPVSILGNVHQQRQESTNAAEAREDQPKRCEVKATTHRKIKIGTVLIMLDMGKQVQCNAMLDNGCEMTSIDRDWVRAKGLNETPIHDDIII